MKRSPLLLIVAAATCGVATLPAADTLVPANYFRTSDPNLEVTLWAASPQIKNPTNFDTDARGRLWVAEGINYRRHYERQPEGDRIQILEDTDGDGKADKTSTFVQEPFLRAPMGIAVIDNQIVVSMAPDIVMYTDVDRNDRFDPAVDRRTVVLTGFNGRVHDHTVHSVSVGPDGQWYWNAGNCGAVITDKSGKTFRIGSAYDPTYGGKKTGDLGWNPRDIAGQVSDDGHVWIGGFAARMNPDGSGVRIIGHNFRNSYEQTVTSFGDVFQNDNDDPPACRTSFLLEGGNAGFCSADGRRSWQADRRPGQSVPVAHWRQEDPGTMPPGDVYGGGSPTGITFVEDSALGAKYRGLLLSAEPGRNVVFGYFPKPAGAGFALERFDFVTSNSEGEFAGGDFKGGDRGVSKELKTWFRPSDVVVGADGAIYVADFFDPRVGGHNDMDESVSGAIYRIAPKAFRPRVPKVDFTTLDGAIAGLKSPAVNVRGAAFYALQREGAAAVKPLSKLLKDENPFIRARAVWLLALQPEGLPMVAKLLRNEDPQMRVVAFRALRRAAEEGRVVTTRSPGQTPGTREFFLATAARLATDPEAAVRREVAVSLRDLQGPEVENILMTLAKGYDGQDRMYLEAWGTGAKGKEAVLYARLKEAYVGDANPVDWPQAFAQLVWRLHPEAAVPAFAVRASSSRLPDAQRKAALTALAFVPSRSAAQAMIETTAAADSVVKAEAIWWLLNRKDSAWKEFGVNEALKQSGIYDPEAVELIPATVPAPDAPKFAVADVKLLTGDATQGAAKAATCFSCHRIGNQGTEYAPNLTGWAQRQPSEVLIQSIINPSADIAHGYSGMELKLKDGTEIQGLVLSEGDPVIVASAGGLTQMVPAGRIASKKGLGRSLMLSADQQGLSAQDVADLAAWLKTQ